MAMLYDKGLFCYDDKIAKHWPNFGQNGKENIQICDVLRHESGLAHFSESIPTIKNAWHDNIKMNKIGAFIEKEKQHFPKVSKTEYHAMSRGLILNEVIRRIDPKVGTLSCRITVEVRQKYCFLYCYVVPNKAGWQDSV
jgi:CubicO group peptidase (beta-lactamase class C family)